MRSVVSRFAVLLALALASGCTLLSSPADFDGDGAVIRDAAVRDALADADARPDGMVMPPECHPPAEVVMNKTAMGAACTANEQCASGNCALWAAFRRKPAAAAFTDSVCTRACGDDCDCPEDYICSDQGSGVRLCLNPTAVGLTVGKETQSYANGPGQCTSGVGSNNRCAITCADDAACEGTDVCGGFPEYGVASQVSCIPASDTGFSPAPNPTGDRAKDIGDACVAHPECLSRLCVSNECVEPCRSTADCDAGLLCRRNDAHFDNPSDARNDLIVACLPPLDEALDEAAALTNAQDTRLCKNGNRTGDGRDGKVVGDRWCSPLCATDADCKVHGASLRCLPYRTVDNADANKQEWSTLCGK